MAIVWQSKQGSTTYRVTQAGYAIRLYRNNVLHSQWNTNRPISGKLWDLFLLSSLSDDCNISKVLVLGAGGGAIVNLVHHFFPRAYIDAIDLDQVHLYVAKKYFKTSQIYCRLIYANVQQWLKHHKNNNYDLIVDDVFAESNDVPYRSIFAHGQWTRALLKRLSRHGTLVINFADKKEYLNSRKVWEVNNIIGRYQVAVASHKSCDNRIVYVSKNDLSKKRLLQNLLACNANNYLRYLKEGTFSHRKLR